MHQSGLGSLLQKGDWFDAALVFNFASPVALVSPHSVVSWYLVDDSALGFPQREAVRSLGQHPGGGGQQARDAGLGAVVADAQQSLCFAEAPIAKANRSTKR